MVRVNSMSHLNRSSGKGRDQILRTEAPGGGVCRVWVNTVAASKVNAGATVTSQTKRTEVASGPRTARLGTMAGNSLRNVQQLDLTLVAGAEPCAQQSWLAAGAGAWH